MSELVILPSIEGLGAKLGKGMRAIDSAHNYDRLTFYQMMKCQ
jgi:hypothetical protein